LTKTDAEEGQHTTWRFCASVARPTNINKVQSQTLVRADTTTTNFSANFQLIFSISRRTGRHNSNATPAQSPGRWQRYL